MRKTIRCLALFFLAQTAWAEEIRIDHFVCRENYIAAYEIAEHVQEGESFFQLAVNLDDLATSSINDSQKYAGILLASDNLPTIMENVKAGMTPEQVARRERVGCIVKYNRVLELVDPNVVHASKS